MNRPLLLDTQQKMNMIRHDDTVIYLNLAGSRSECINGLLYSTAGACQTNEGFGRFMNRPYD